MPTSVMIVSRNRDAVAVLRECFDKDRRPLTSETLPLADGPQSKKVWDLVFVDLDILHPSGPLAGHAAPSPGPQPGEGERHRNGFRSDIETLRRAFPGAAVIVMAPAERVRSAVEAVQAGADNYLTHPLALEEVRYVIQSLAEMHRVEAELQFWRGALDRDTQGQAETNSPLMRRIHDKARAAAPTSTLILLTGETGTGKSLMARLIHDNSSRKGKQFIAVHCGAIPDTLVESELFGHEKGAFTGAVRRKLGKFELAQGGTLFLDELATMPPAAQVKLLQALQDKTFQRVGGESVIKADARIIAATNMDLKTLVDQGRFRSDLYFRLNVFPIEIPPLRERIEDIPNLVRSFLRRLNAEYNKGIREASLSLMQALAAYDWPGNVRELENLVERAYILETSSILTSEGFPEELVGRGLPAATIPLNMDLTLREFRAQARDDAEGHYLRELLSRHKGRINATAQAADLTPRRLHDLMAKHGLRKEDFKN